MTSSFVNAPTRNSFENPMSAVSSGTEQNPRFDPEEIEYNQSSVV
jgi:hypothetical protein